MSKRAVRVVALLVGITIAALLAPSAWRRLEARIVRTHQHSVTRELANWEQEHSQISSWQEADRAVGMLEYVQVYYVVGPGYRSDPETEAALEAQRERTVAAIVSALQEFSGQDFGTDPALWQAWLEWSRPPAPGN